MERIEYLPLGSVVLLKGGLSKLVIIARGLRLNHEGQEVYFDYGGVPYPYGLTGDQMAYFNHDGIVQVVFKGYDDQENKIMVNNINAYIESNELVKGDPLAWDKMKG